MKNNQLFAIAFTAIMALSLSSCEVVGGIFKAGVWVGVLIVVAIIGIIIWLFSRGGKS